MSTIKSDRIDFEKLLNGLDPIAPSTCGTATESVNVPQQQAPATGVVDSASGAQVMQEPLFQFDYDSERKGLRKKCRKTILGIVNHVIPPDMIDDEYVQDKIEQDIETLTELYMQVRLNTVMQRANVEMTARGNYTARTTETFGQLTDKIQSINKQIFETEQRIRKTYLDLKFEIRDKQSEGFAISGNANGNLIGGCGDDGVLVTSSKSMIENAKNFKIEAFKNAKETKVKVIQ